MRACVALPSFRGEASFRTWLFRILVRLAAAPARRRRPEPSGSMEVDVPAGVGQEPDELALGRELRDRLDEAMERLPVRQRTALHLRAAEGFGYEKIGRVLECSPGAARMLVLEARRKILERLGGYLEP